MIFTRKNLSIKTSVTFAEEATEKSRLCLVRADDKTGARAYYFLLLDRLRIREFKEAIAAKKPFDLKEFGDVVASGYGERVPESLRIRMRVEYA
jgi:hypothetical protein